jgi:prepilin-type processing-associated H-X9-DG protein
MRKRRLSRWEVALFGVPLLIFAVPLLLRLTDRMEALHPLIEFFQPAQRARRSTCQSWQQQIGLALLAYAKDSDGKFPVATSSIPRMSGTIGWADAIQPWFKCLSCYHCPNSKALPNSNPSLPGYTDYWFNANRSAVQQSDVPLPTATLLAGEGADGVDKTDAAYSKSRLPVAWLNNPRSPAFRHLGGANYLFVDGHVAWLKPNQVTNCYGRANCFAVK